MQKSLDTHSQVALYARVSTEEQRDGQTIDSQIAELERFAQGRTWSVNGIYKDEGWSGSLLARPALDQLRDDALKGHFIAVLVNDVDRLARDVTHLGIVKRDLERHGIQVIFRKLPTDSSPTQNLMVNVLGSFAEFERELIADRTRRGRRYKVEVRKQFVGTIAPYGFRYVRRDRAAGADGCLQLDSQEAPIVRQMYAWVDRDGLSARMVVARLNRLGPRPRKGGREWGKSSVVRILRSETYAGVWHYCKFEAYQPVNPTKRTSYRKSLKSSIRLRTRDEWLPLTLPPSLHLIPRDQWERVQRQLDRNVTFSPRNGRHTYLLRGLVRCGGCAARYVGQPSHGRFAYRCLSRCKQVPQISESRLNGCVWNAVAEALRNPKLITDQLGCIRGAEDRLRSQAAGDSTESERAMRQLKEEEARILEAYRQRVLSLDQLRDQLDALKRRRAGLGQLQVAANGGRAADPPAAAVKRSVDEYCQVVADRLDRFSVEDRQRLLRLLIREVVFEGSRVRIKGVIPVTETPSRSSAVVPAERPTAGGDIAAKDIRSCGRNPSTNGDIAATDIGGWVRNVPGAHVAVDGTERREPITTLFELTCEMPPLPYLLPAHKSL